MNTVEIDMDKKMKPDAPDDQPDWPPRMSAWRLRDGERRYGSTGQLWEIRDHRWVRVKHSDLPKS